MKKITILILAACSLCLIAACNKETNTDMSVERNGAITTISASIDEAETKASLSNDTPAKFAWSVGDMVSVYTTNGWKNSSELTANDIDPITGIASFSFSGLIEENRTLFAVFPRSIHYPGAPSSNHLTVELPKSYTLAQVSGTATPCPMIALNKPDKGLSFKQLCGVLRLTVNSLPGSAQYLTINFNKKKVSGHFTVSVEGGDVQPGISSIATSGANFTDDTIIITDLGGTPGTWRDGVVINLPLPVGDYSNITVTAYDSNDKEILTVTRAMKIGAASYTAVRAQGKKTTASLPAFSVSDTKRVAIAKSNLQYTRPNTTTPWTSGTWRFADNAWDIVETAEVSENYANETAIGLFGWGTSGYAWTGALAAAYGTSNKPWSTDTTPTNYGPIWGNTQGENNLTGVFANGDWGKVMAADSPWRVPTEDELAYIVNNSERKAHAIVGSRKGLILIPDYFVDPKTSEGTGGAFVPGDAANTYTEENWMAMEAHGAIFMPSSKSRRGTQLSSGSNWPGLYWTSTGTNGTGVKYSAKALFLSTMNVGNCGGDGRATGICVRLVRSID